MNKKIKYSISILLFGVLMIYLYTFLHEGGHALIAIICGGKIDAFVLGANAHVKASGANYTVVSEALLNAAGVLFPVLFMMIALAIYKPTIKNTLYHIFYGYMLIGITCSLLAWVAIPLIALFTIPPVGDDATKFLNITGLPPFIVSLVALLIILSLVFVAYKKGMIGKLKVLICEFSNGTKINEVKFLKLKLLIGIMLGVIAVVVGINVLVPKPAFETSLSIDVNGMTEDVKVPFELKKSKIYSMDLKLEAKGTLTDIQIYDESGNQVFQTFCEWLTLNTSLNLEKGKYVLVLTFLQDSNEMQEHIKEKGYIIETGMLEQFEELYKINSQDENHPFTFSGIIN